MKTTCLNALCGAISLALLTGCATSRKGPQPSVMIEGRTPAQVRAAASEQVLGTDRMWNPVRASEMELVFEKDLPFGAQIFVQEIGAQPARHQLHLLILERDKAVQLFGSMSTITTHFGNPQRHDNMERDWEIHWLLDAIRARALGETIPAMPTPPPQPPARSPKGQ